MMTLLRLAEFIIAVVVIRSLVKMFKPSTKNRSSGAASSPKKVYRFDGKEQDISDGDYEEMR